MKNNNKVKIQNKKKILFGISLVLVVVLGIIIFCQKDKETLTFGDNKAVMEEVKFELNEELLITKVGNFSGKYMEDASDEQVSNVMAIMLTNISDKTLQYAEIILSGEDGDAVFSVTTLKPDESMLVLEATRKEYKNGYTKASIKNAVFFEEDLELYRNVFYIQPLDGGFNITNISNKDIEAEIVIYFKDKMNEIYYGGITYRGRIEGGLKSGEIRQIMTDNFSESNTEVMFITIIDK